MPAWASAVASILTCAVGCRPAKASYSNSGYFHDEDEASGIHRGIDLVGGDLDGRLEQRLLQCGLYSARKFGAVFVDDADPDVFDLELCAGRLSINRKAERIARS